MGAAGGIVGVGCLAPAETVEIWERFRAGELGPAGTVQDRIAPAHNRIVRDLGVAGVKYALDLLGYAGGPPRSPLRALDETGRRQVGDVLARARLVSREARSSA